MTVVEAFADNNLARGIYHTVGGGAFGDRYELVPVTTPELAQKIKDSRLRGLDYRAKVEPESGFATVFEGLAFDPHNLRSQSFALLDCKENEPVGVMTTVVAPRTWILNQRYFKRESDGVSICDFSAVSGGHIPDYLIIPAWTKVVPEHLLHFAIPGFRAFRKIISVLQDSAPKDTWMEVIAQGEWPMARRDELSQLVNRGVGAYIHESELPFQLNQIGKPSEASSSSTKMAPLVGLHRVERVGSSITLGPTFAKLVK